MAKAMSKEPITSASAESIVDAVRAAQGKGLPPVETWSPAPSGDMDMVIRRDGAWVHEGGVIHRHELARLFSTILKREGDDYFLVTPVEKWRIRVEDAPFVAVDLQVEGTGEAQSLIFETNMGEQVVAGEGHAIRVTLDRKSGEPSPYIHVRSGLDALIDRKSFYRLVERGVHRQGWFGVWSGAAFFRIAPSGDMAG